MMLPMNERTNERSGFRLHIFVFLRNFEEKCRNSKNLSRSHSLTHTHPSNKHARALINHRFAAPSARTFAPRLPPRFADEGMKVLASPMSHGVPCVGYVCKEIDRPGRLRNEVALPPSKFNPRN